MARTATANKIHYEEDSRLYHDVFYRARLPHMEEYFHKLLRLFAPQARHVLEVNACTADLAIYLSLRGYQVSALEPVEKLCRLARAKVKSLGVSVAIEHSDILAYASRDTFDAVTMRQSVHRIQESMELLDIFKNIHDRLQPKGILLFDTPRKPEFECGQAPLYTYETAVKIQKGRSVPRPEEDTMVTNWNVATKNYNVHIDAEAKLYSQDLLSALLTQAGLVDIKFFDASMCMGFVRIPEAHANSSTIICVARKSA